MVSRPWGTGCWLPNVTLNHMYHRFDSYCPSMRVNGLEWDDTIGWYDPSQAYCINGDGRPAVVEELYGMYNDKEIVQLVCLECRDAAGL